MYALLVWLAMHYIITSFAIAVALDITGYKGTVVQLLTNATDLTASGKVHALSLLLPG